MSQPPPLTEAAIRDRVGDRNFREGEKYLRDRAVFDARRQGTTLRARCHGQSGGPYRVEATLEGGRVAGGDCSCPVGDGGACKHVAALLLAWARDHKKFVEVEPVETALAQRTKEELVSIIKHMLRREPDLETLLDTPLPGVKGDKPAKPAAYRRQAEAAFARDSGEWGSWREVADELEDVKALGDGFLEHGDFASASAVYLGVAEAVEEHYDRGFDEEGDIGGVLAGCAEGLGKCLPALPPGDPHRAAVLRGLFEVVRLDVEHGGIGLDAEAAEALDEHASKEERRQLADWVREAMKGAGEWARESLGGWLLDLEADELDDEAYLKLCRKTGQRFRLVERLLERGRLDEAEAAAREASDYDLLGLADLLARHGQGPRADRLVAERARTSTDTRLLEWQKKRAEERGDEARVLDLSTKLFRHRPSLHDYRELREVAARQGGWDKLRPQLLSFLKKQKDDALLTEVYLDEGDIDNALALVQPRRPGRSYYGDSLELKVAEAAEKERPREALEIYRRHAEARVEQRGRDAYREAARHLGKVRDLSGRVGDATAFEGYLAKLREKYKTLRAFQEEVKAAGL